MLQPVVRLVPAGQRARAAQAVDEVVRLVGDAEDGWRGLLADLEAELEDLRAEAGL